MITLITPSSSQPRFHKRALALFNSTLLATVFSFQRNYYNVNKFDSRINVEYLSYLQNGKYWIRLIKILKAIFVITKHRRLTKTPVCYAFSIDCAIIGILSGYPELIYEIGDIRSNSKLSSIIESYIFKKAKIICVTSGAFKDYFQKKHKVDGCKIIVLDNKMTHIPRIDKKISETIRIGVIGYLRYERPLNYIRRFASENATVKLLVYGDGPNKDVFENGSNIEYFGPFKNPEDLDKIYNSIDLSYVVYENNNINVRLALPNKLYESLGYKTPIVVSEETYLEQLVKNFNIGNSVSLNSYEKFTQGIKKILVNLDLYRDSSGEYALSDYMDCSDDILIDNILDKCNINNS